METCFGTYNIDSKSVCHKNGDSILVEPEEANNQPFRHNVVHTTPFWNQCNIRLNKHKTNKIIKQLICN